MAILRTDENGHVEDPRNNQHADPYPPYIFTDAIIRANNGVLYNYTGGLAHGSSVTFDVDDTYAVNVVIV